MKRVDDIQIRYRHEQKNQVAEKKPPLAAAQEKTVEEIDQKHDADPKLHAHVKPVIALGRTVKHLERKADDHDDAA